jgi:hypothetical protein
MRITRNAEQAQPAEFLLRRTEYGALQMFVDGVDLLAHHRICDLNVHFKDGGRIIDYTIVGVRLLASPAAKP